MIREWMKRWRAGGKARQEIDPEKLEQAIDDLKRYVSRDLRGGYVSVDEIVDSAIEIVAEEQLDAQTLRPHAQRALEQEIAAYRQDERGWPEVTDYDRLDRTFAELERQGIVCRQNFSCCGTCGSAEIWDEVREAEAAGLPVRGYAFFHMQDTESAIDGGGLYLNYGAVTEGETPALVVAREVADALARAGLQIDWDGSWDRRIGVRLDWQRRLAL